MPKLVCACGNYIHNLSAIPDDGFIIVHDREYEDLIETENLRTNLSAENPEEGTKEWEKLIGADAKIMNITERVYECPVCNKLMWLRNDGKTYIYELKELLV
ncbi:hypothetical protein [Paenibacillus vini]|uniref:TFIIS-type domain-containing protein n=1 Tax=Paenibacillus vini TaxID=1476024 RepID=A0ABQ4MCD8_9BACL|nr:hypothetical protein [Paenibacillus vini]GIP53603.1 hypothetical protein J42TS3_26380 [Paenibacillus vini]